MISRLEVYDTLVKHGELTFRELCVELGAWDIDSVNEVRNKLDFAVSIGEANVVGATILRPIDNMNLIRSSATEDSC